VLAAGLSRIGWPQLLTLRAAVNAEYDQRRAVAQGPAARAQAFVSRAIQLGVPESAARELRARMQVMAGRIRFGTVKPCDVVRRMGELVDAAVVAQPAVAS
jgi:hypothetical protein